MSNRSRHCWVSIAALGGVLLAFNGDVSAGPCIIDERMIRPPPDPSWRIGWGFSAETNKLKRNPTCFVGLDAIEPTFHVDVELRAIPTEHQSAAGRYSHSVAVTKRYIAEYRMRDDATLRFSPSVVRMLEGHDYAGFHDACGTHYVRMFRWGESLNYYVTYESDSAARDESFEASLARDATGAGVGSVRNVDIRYGCWRSEVDHIIDQREWTQRFRDSERWPEDNLGPTAVEVAPWFESPAFTSLVARSVPEQQVIGENTAFLAAMERSARAQGSAGLKPDMAGSQPDESTRRWLKVHRSDLVVEWSYRYPGVARCISDLLTAGIATTPNSTVASCQQLAKQLASPRPRPLEEPGPASPAPPRPPTPSQCGWWLRLAAAVGVVGLLLRWTRRRRLPPVAL